MSAPIPQAAFQSGALTTGVVKNISRPVKYPIPALAVGEWLDVPLAGYPSPSGRDAAAYRLKDAACRYGRAYGRRYSVKTLRADGVARCTRIA